MNKRTLKGGVQARAVPAGPLTIFRIVDCDCQLPIGGGWSPECSLKNKRLEDHIPGLAAYLGAIHLHTSSLGRCPRGGRPRGDPGKDGRCSRNSGDTLWHSSVA